MAPSLWRAAQEAAFGAFLPGVVDLRTPQGTALGSRSSSCRRAESQAQLHGTALQPCPNTWRGGTGRDVGRAQGSRAGACCVPIQTQRAAAWPSHDAVWTGGGSGRTVPSTGRVRRARPRMCVRGHRVLGPLLARAVGQNCSMKRSPQETPAPASQDNSHDQDGMGASSSLLQAQEGDAVATQGKGSARGKELAHGLCRGVRGGLRSPGARTHRWFPEAVLVLADHEAGPSKPASTQPHSHI